MRPTRISMINGLFHVTVRCNNQRFSFKNDEDFLEYLSILEKAREKHKCKIHAYCITSNHVHLLISTPYEDNLSILMHYINGLYARNYNRRHGRTGHFWAERFYSTVIESETQLLNTIIYIELNMTRNGVTKHPREWRWSSYSQHVEGNGPIEIDYHEIYLRLGDTAEKRYEKYTLLMTESMLNKGLLSKQPQLTYGLICGSESFIKSVISDYASGKYYENRNAYLIVGSTHCLRKFKRRINVR